MRNALIAVFLAVGAPGLLLPGGIELRMCFCGGIGGVCCDSAPAKSGCPRCKSLAGPAGRAHGAVAAKTETRCPGCVHFSVPAGNPARSTPAAPSIDVALPPAGEIVALPVAEAALAQIPVPILRHPPPGQRTLPLLI